MLSWPDYFYTCVRRRKLLFHKPYDQGFNLNLYSNECLIFKNSHTAGTQPINRGRGNMTVFPARTADRPAVV
jgi:hypothetical protein